LKTEKRGKAKIGANVQQNRSNHHADFQFKRSKVSVSLMELLMNGCITTGQHFALLVSTAAVVALKKLAKYPPYGQVTLLVK